MWQESGGRGNEKRPARNVAGRLRAGRFVKSELCELPAGFAPATAATAAAESTTAAATTAAESTALGTRTRFVDVQRAAVKFLAIKSLDGFRRFGLIGHFDKGKAARLTCVAIANYAGFFNSAVCGKGSLELRLRGLISKVSNKNIRH